MKNVNIPLLVQFKDVFDDKPGRTTVVEHAIKLVPDARPLARFEILHL